MIRGEIHILQELPTSQKYFIIPVQSVFRQRLFPWTYNALSLVHYHVSPGWHHTDHMKRTQFLPTLYYGLKPVWINKLSKNGVSFYSFQPNCTHAPTSTHPDFQCIQIIAHCFKGIILNQVHYYYSAGQFSVLYM